MYKFLPRKKHLKFGNGDLRNPVYIVKLGFIGHIISTSSDLSVINLNSMYFLEILNICLDNLRFSSNSKVIKTVCS